MQRFHQLVFIGSLLSLSWFGMMAVHEVGHVVGAVATGGSVERVVLHPFTISRTDVSPNPSPLSVVWLGPILGCVVPAVVALAVPRRHGVIRKLAMFFAGFCLLANGAYIAFGSFDRVGDCGVMLQHGAPRWMLWAFGALTIPMGFFAWHGLGSVKNFLADPTHVDPIIAYTLLIALIVAVALSTAL